MSRTYVKNMETGKIELRFDKSDYLALSADQKKELKRHYLWSSKSSAWVSRSIHNQWGAIETAKKLGFEDGGKTGERLSYAEELERKAEKAEHRAERYEQYADNAEHRAEGLQAELNSHRGDIAFFTQPIISGHAGSQAFARRRQRIYDRYGKGFEEYRKSDYFRDRAATARTTADMKQLKNKPYLQNRIDECNARIRELERSIVKAEQGIHDGKGPDYEKWLDGLLDKMEYETDKLAFFENAMDELGGVKYSKSNIKPGYLVKIRGAWRNVLKANPKTVESIVIEGGAKGFILSHPYAEIQDIKVPEGWTEPKITFDNPFVVGDIVCKHRPADNSIYVAFQIVRTTAKTVTIRKIQITDGKPVPDTFISNQLLRKNVLKNRSGVFVLNDNNWYLYKYTGVSNEQSA